MKNVPRQRPRRDQRQELSQRHRRVYLRALPPRRREGRRHGQRLRFVESYGLQSAFDGFDSRGLVMRFCSFGTGVHEVDEPRTDHALEAHQGHRGHAPHVRAGWRVLVPQRGGYPATARGFVERRGGHAEVAEVFEPGGGSDFTLNLRDVGEAFLREHVAARRPGLVHHRQPVAGVALQPLGERDRRGRCRGGWWRWRAVQMLRVAFSPLDRREDGVVVDGVGFIPRAEGEDPRIKLDTKTQLRRVGG